MANPEDTQSTPLNYMNPSQLAQFYAQALMSSQQQPVSKPPVYTWANALSDVSGKLTNAMLMRSLMGASVARQQQAASAFLPPDAGVSSGSPSSPTAPSDSVHPGVPPPAPPGVAVSPIDQSFRLSALAETGKSGPEALSNISPDTGGSKSYGPLGLNNKMGDLGDFVSQYGDQLGLPQNINDPGFDKAWTSAAKNNPSGMWAANAHYHANTIMPSVTSDLTNAGLDPSMANDPRVVAYFGDRKVQQGTLGLQTAVDAGKAANDPQQFLAAVSASDRANLPNYFKTYLSEHPQNINGLNNRITTRFQHSMALQGGISIPQAQGASEQPVQGQQPISPMTQGADTSNASAAVPAGQIPQQSPVSPAGSPATVNQSAGSALSGTFVNTDILPKAPYVDWDKAKQNWAAYSPQQQAQLIQQANTVRQPQVYQMPDGSGTVTYHFDNPSQQTFTPATKWVTEKGYGGTEKQVPLTYDMRTRNWVPMTGQPLPGGPAQNAVPNAAPSIAAPESAATYEGQKALGKSYAEQQFGLDQQAQTAQTESEQLALAEQILKDPRVMNPGTGGPWGASAANAFRQMGIGEGDMATLNQVLQKLGQSASLANIQEMAKYGAVRVPEMQMINKSNYDPNNTPQANLAVVGLRKRLADRQVELADASNDYAKSHGGLIDGGFWRERRAFYKQNPLISQAEMANPSAYLGIGSVNAPAPQAALSEQSAPPGSPAPSGGLMQPSAFANQGALAAMNNVQQGQGVNYGNDTNNTFQGNPVLNAAGATLGGPLGAVGTLAPSAAAAGLGGLAVLGGKKVLDYTLLGTILKALEGK